MDYVYPPEHEMEDLFHTFPIERHEPPCIDPSSHFPFLGEFFEPEWTRFHD